MDRRNKSLFRDEGSIASVEADVAHLAEINRQCVVHRRRDFGLGASYVCPGPGYIDRRPGSPEHDGPAGHQGAAAGSERK